MAYLGEDAKTASTKVIMEDLKSHNIGAGLVAVSLTARWPLPTIPTACSAVGSPTIVNSTSHHTMRSCNITKLNNHERRGLARQPKLDAAATLQSAIRVVGIDDWRRRRATSYGTITVDLECRSIIDILDDRHRG